MSFADVAAAEVLGAIVDAPGAEPRVDGFILPHRAPGSTLLAVIAAPLNPLDLLIASGTFHSARHEEPYVPGSECVGVVLASDTFALGELVYAECNASPGMPGALATRVVVADDRILPLPEGVDPVDAAAIGNSGVAAYLPLIELAGLRVGETVLVLGATGAVGQLAVQIARRNGAGRVVGVGRNREALDKLLTLGADAVVDLRAEEGPDGLAERVKATAGEVDVVLDGLYGEPLEAALQVCAPHARVVNIGNLAGPVARVPAGLLRGRQIALLGFAGLHVPFSGKRAALEWLWGALVAGDIQLAVQTYPLEELPAAWKAQAESPHGKSVIAPDASLLR